MPVWGEPIVGGSSAHDFGADPVLEANFSRSDRVDVEDRFNGGMREQTIHRFLRDGEQVDVWGSADLDGKLRGLKGGQLVRIVYVGTEPLEGGKTIKRFTVQVAEPEPVDRLAADDDIPF